MGVYISCSFLVIFSEVTLCLGCLYRTKKVDRLNIALLTDLVTPASSDHLDVIIKNLKQADITLQFL